MSPRRGGSGGSYYGGYGYYNNNPWEDEVDLSMESLVEPKSFFIAGFAFDVLTVIALIGFLVWACLIRNHRGSMRGVIVSVVTWLIYAILIVIYEVFFLANATLTEYYRIDPILFDFFGILNSCIMFFVFYNLIHGLLDRLTDAGKPYAVVSGIHWVILGLVSALSLAAWGLFVAYEVLDVNDAYNGPVSVTKAYVKVDGARSIVYWIVSLEILAWAIFVIVKAGYHRFNSKTPAIALIIGSVFFFALNLMWAVVSIAYSLDATYYNYPQYMDVVESVCQFSFVIGIYVGILLCCSNWSKLDKFAEQPAVTAQYPYGAMPGNQHYQTYQPYPQQAYPQPQQPYPQQPYPQHQQ